MCIKLVVVRRWQSGRRLFCFVNRQAALDKSRRDYVKTGRQAIDLRRLIYVVADQRVHDKRCLKYVNADQWVLDKRRLGYLRVDQLVREAGKEAVWPARVGADLRAQE